MASFAEQYEEWKQLDQTATATGSRDAKVAAEQARIGLSHHPSVNAARSFHTAKVAGGPRGKARS